MRIIIEAVSYTPGKDAVLVYYTNFPGDPTPFPGTHIFHTSQAALSRRSGNPGYWSDAEIRTELLNYLSEHGFSVEIIPAPETKRGRYSNILKQVPEPEV
jgi:hypothetical protein